MKGILFVLTLVFVAACTSTSGPSEPVMLADNYYEFDQTLYNQARADGKYVFLDFHADWCSICRAEAPNIRAAFNNIERDDIVGFQVNFNDGRTSTDERNLAREYNIRVQHTKVITDQDGTVLTRDLRGPSSSHTIENQILTAVGN